MGFLARALESRQQFTSISHPAQWLIDAFNGGASASGKAVTPENARTVPAMFAAMRCIAEDIATLPFPVFQRTTGGSRERKREHAVHCVLNVRANPRQTACELREVLMWHALLRGNAYAEIVREGGTVTGLLPFHPDRIERVLADDESLWFRYQNPETGETIVYAPDEVLHLVGPGDDGYGGLSLVQLFRTAIGMSMSAEEYGARFFANDASPGGALEHPNKLGKEAFQKLKDSWNARHQGSGNAHRLAIFEEGMKYVQLGFMNKDAQFLETRQFQVTEVARIFRIPPHKIQAQGSETIGNFEQQAIQYVVDTLRPWSVRWEQRVLLGLFTEEERGQGYYAEHVMDALLRGDQKTRYDAYAVGIQNSFMSPSQVATLENWPPIEGGEVHFAPLNVTRLDKVGEVPAGGGVQPTPGSGTPNNGGRTPAAGARALALATAGLLGNAWSRLERRREQGGLKGLEEYADQVLGPLLDAYAIGLRALGAEGSMDLTVFRRSLGGLYLRDVAAGTVDPEGWTATAMAMIEAHMRAAPAA